MLCEVTSTKHALVSLEKIWTGQMGRLGPGLGQGEDYMDIFNVQLLNGKILLDTPSLT
jgi:hypothetical protein